MAAPTEWFEELRDVVEELGFVDAQTDMRDTFAIIKALLRGDATVPRGTPDQYDLKQLEAEHAENASKVLLADSKLVATYRRLRIPVSVTVSERITMHVDPEFVHLTIKG